MTEIERYEPQHGEVVLHGDVDSWVHVLAPVGDLAAKIAGTDFVPKDFRGKPAAVAAAILFGREVGLPPVTALKNTYVVHGTPDLSAEAQRALVFAAGHEIEFVETTATRCKMRGRRRGSEDWTPASYTIDEAKQSGDYAKNSNYKTRPQEMLVARCTSRLCSMIFSDCTGGFSSSVNVPLPVGEVESIDENEAPAVTVTQERPRKPAQRRKTKAAPAPAPTVEAAQDGPPLPGEDGYEELAPPEPEKPDDIADAEIVEDAEPSPAQVKALHAALNAAGLGTREDKLRFCGEVVDREIGSSKDLTADEVSKCLDVLKNAAGLGDAETVDEPSDQGSES